jgi:putative nucleotidyltransferase with HDIG domain
MSDQQQNWIAVDQLRIGVYVYIDLGWLDHPFSFNSFKIKSEDQLRTIRSLGLKRLRWDPDKSDPPESAPVSAPVATEPAPIDAEAEAAMIIKKARIERLKQHREQLARVQQAFINATTTARAINRTIFTQPRQTIEKTEQLVRQMVETFLAAPEVAIQVMSEKPGGEEVYLHSVNVTVLSMMVGRELDLSEDEMQILGVGTLFHDIGMAEVPSTIRLKTEPLTRPERDFYELHCQYGLDIAKRVGLPPATHPIIHQHHEFQDGSGYPQRLAGEAINPLARIVVAANHYDSLCNPPNIADALTPHEALSQMFAQQRARFDPKVLQILIRCLGVFPPGTVVRLNNDAVGLVISVNASRPLKPTVIIYDADVPKQEAIIIDLETEPDIGIAQAMRPSQLPHAIYNYLNPRKRVSYYFDAQAGKPAGAG